MEGRGWYTGGEDEVGSRQILSPEGDCLAPRRDILDYSPDLGWGCASERCYQAAVALMADYIARLNEGQSGDVEAAVLVGTRAFSAKLASELLVALPPTWRLQARAVGEFSIMHHKLDAGHLVDFGLWRASILERGLLVAHGPVRIRTM